MPDRDFATKAVGPLWGSACRLYVLDGPTEATVSKTERALARALREATRRRRSAASTLENLALPAASDVEAIERFVSASLLAPSRNLKIDRGLHFEQVDADERQLLTRMRPQTQHLSRQLSSGAMPRRAPRRRPTLQSVLSRQIRVDLKS